MTPTTEQLKDLLAKVTPGEWEEITPEGGIWPPRVFSGSAIVSMVDNSDMTHGEKVANATLIALAPTLAAEVVRLRSVLEDIAQSAEDDDGWTSDGHERCTYAARQALDATSEK